MKTAAGAAVLVAGTLLLAAPALAQYYPTTPAPPPPPQYYPPPPPPPQYYPPPQPVYYAPPPEDKQSYTIRASGGVAFVGAGYYCSYYYYYYPTYACGAGYSTAFPDVNLDVDVWLKPSLGLTLGANVMWGTYTPYGSYYGNASGVTTYTTIWEPHVDFLVAPPYSTSVKGRVRLGFGLYIVNVNNGNPGGTVTPYAFNGVGGAFRLGFGASILPKSKVGIGIDAIFEAGWVDGTYVSTVQLLIGPEIHFF